LCEHSLAQLTRKFEILKGIGCEIGDVSEELCTTDVLVTSLLNHGLRTKIESSRISSKQNMPCGHHKGRFGTRKVIAKAFGYSITKLRLECFSNEKIVSGEYTQQYIILLRWRYSVLCFDDATVPI
jgi:hypothetical protein